MPTASKLLPLTTVPIQFGDEVLTIKYSRAALTPAVEREYRRLTELRATDQEAARAAVLYILPLMIKEWDMLLEDGTVMPIEAEMIEQHLPLDVLLEITAAVFSDNSPKVTSPNDSTSTSKPEAP
jgi:hypothetical protein